MKKYIFIIGIIFILTSMLFILTGCGNENTQESSEMKETQEDTEESEEVMVENITSYSSTTEEEMKITAENIQTKIGEHLKYVGFVYFGCYTGWEYLVYEENDVTESVTIPGVEDYNMIYEIVGLESIQNLKNQVATYISSSAVSKINDGLWKNTESDYSRRMSNYRI